MALWLAAACSTSKRAVACSACLFYQRNAAPRALVLGRLLLLWRFVARLQAERWHAPAASQRAAYLQLLYLDDTLAACNISINYTSIFVNHSISFQFTS
jgi:hypothetical protein